MERHTFINKLTRIRNVIRQSNLSKEQIDLILDETVNKLINGEAARIEQIIKESNPFWTWDSVKQYLLLDYFKSNINRYGKNND